MEEKESLLSRWMRLKRAATRGASAGMRPPAAQADPAPAVLPSVEDLDFSSDFSVFLRPQVEEPLKRAALRKLFHSGQFNTMDGLDVYIDDYNRFEPIPEEMLRQLRRARGLLDAEDGQDGPADRASGEGTGRETVSDEGPARIEPSGQPQVEG